MAEHYDYLARASDPGGLEFATDRLKQLYPQYFRFLFRKMVRASDPIPNLIEAAVDHMRYGDSRAAVVISVSPFLVAAYTDELDCVALLRFPDSLRAKYASGDRLLTVNTYASLPQVVSDLIPGDADTGNWENFRPMIADFFSEQTGKIDARKNRISQPEWDRTEQLGREYLERMPNYQRDGFPFHCQFPGTPDEFLPENMLPPENPVFEVTSASCERLLGILDENKLSTEDVAIVLSSTFDHPEIFDYDFQAQPKLALSPSKYHFLDYGEGLQVAYAKTDAIAFDGMVLGYDHSREGFHFAPKRQGHDRRRTR